MTRLYEIWPSENRFFFQGRIFSGPSKDVLPMSSVWLALIGLPILFAVLVCPLVIQEVPFLGFLLAFGLLAFVVAVFSLACCNFKDPGIVPRSHLQVFVPSITAEESREYIFDDPALVNPAEVCHTCHIKKRSGLHHCSQCNNCVEGFDHHCVFIGNCVGRRNIGNFVVLLFSSALLSYTVAVLSAIHFALCLQNHPEVKLSERDKWILIGAAAFIGLTPLYRVFISICCHTRLPRLASLLPMGIGIAVLVSVSLNSLWGRGAQFLLYNPMGIFLTIITVPLGTVLFPFACYTTSNLLTEQTTFNRLKQHRRKRQAQHLVDHDEPESDLEDCSSRRVSKDMRAMINPPTPFCGGMCLTWNEKKNPDSLIQADSDEECASPKLIRLANLVFGPVPPAIDWLVEVPQSNNIPHGTGNGLAAY